ncbi:MAG: hypothetical protein J6C61_02490 [Clostridia bacterium]|nr:hypothetical protein [Clostridia bacterium]
MGVVVIQNKENNRFYVHEVALTKIETSVMGDTALRKEGRTRLLPVSNISISQLIKKSTLLMKTFSNIFLMKCCQKNK